MTYDEFVTAHETEADRCGARIVKRKSDTLVVKGGDPASASVVFGALGSSTTKGDLESKWQEKTKSIAHEWAR
jgi:hypothetical protein